MLAYDKHQSTCISDDRFDFYCGFNFDTSDAWENITREYLTNTYGKVESREHAEFIAELAEGCGFTLNARCNEGNFFYVATKKYGFDSKDFCMDGDAKQITIPLPPNNTNTPQEDFEMTQIAKNNGDNLLFGGEDRCNHERLLTQCSENAEATRKALWPDYMDKQKEWPTVGDVVLINNLKCKVIGIDNGAYWIKRNKTGTYDIAKRSQLKKPPTPEEELANKLDEAALATIEIDDLIKLSKAIINGEIKGLSYKPQ